MDVIPKTGPEPEEKSQDTPLRDLTELEQIVNKGKTSFLEVAEALMEIRDRELYLPQTWGEYVKKKFGFSRQYAHRLIQAKQLSDASTAVDKPRTEREAGKRLKEKRSKAKPVSKVVSNLDEEFESFKATVERWEKALSFPDYRNLIAQVVEFVCKRVAEKEVAKC